MPNIKWWIARLWMKLRGEHGCRGEGFWYDAEGHCVVCCRRGCH